MNRHHRYQNRPFAAVIFALLVTLASVGAGIGLAVLMKPDPVPPPKQARPEVLLVPVRQGTAPVDAASRVVRFVRADFQGMGSAFPVARVGKWAAYLTCKHVTTGGLGTLHTMEGAEYLATSLSECPDNDAALVWALVPNVRPLDLRYDSPTFGDEVYASGWTDDVALVMSYGFLGSRARGPLVQGGTAFTFTAPIFFGNSGGPCLDARGRVIGLARLLWAQETPEMKVPYLCAMTPICDVEKWLAETLARGPK